jgi:hypothetical protein
MTLRFITLSPSALDNSAPDHFSPAWSRAMAELPSLARTEKEPKDKKLHQRRKKVFRKMICRFELITCISASAKYKYRKKTGFLKMR